MEERDEFLLEVGPHVDEKVAATEQIDPGEGRVLDHVLFGKDQHVADALIDPVGAAFGLGGEETGQPLGADIGGDAGRIEPGAGRGYRLAVDIGGKDLHGMAPMLFFQLLLQEDGE